MRNFSFKLLPFSVFCAIKIKVIHSDVWVTFFPRFTTDFNEKVRPAFSANNRNCQYAVVKCKRDKGLWTSVASIPIQIRMENRHANHCELEYHAAVFK